MFRRVLELFLLYRILFGGEMDNSHMRIYTKCQPQPKLPSFFLSLAMADCIFKLYQGGWGPMENFPGEVCLVLLGNSKREGSKKLFSRRILAQNTVFQGYLAEKWKFLGRGPFMRLEIPGEGVSLTSEISRGLQFPRCGLKLQSANLKVGIIHCLIHY